MKPTILLICNIFDGVGDIQHAADIYQFLKSQQTLKEFEINILFLHQKNHPQAIIKIHEDFSRSFGLIYCWDFFIYSYDKLNELDDQYQVQLFFQEELFNPVVRNTAIVMWIGCMNGAPKILNNYLPKEAVTLLIGEHGSEEFNHTSCLNLKVPYVQRYL